MEEKTDCESVYCFHHGKGRYAWSCRIADKRGAWWINVCRKNIQLKKDKENKEADCESVYFFHHDKGRYAWK